MNFHLNKWILPRESRHSNLQKAGGIQFTPELENSQLTEQCGNFVWLPAACLHGLLAVVLSLKRPAKLTQVYSGLPSLTLPLATNVA